MVVLGRHPYPPTFFYMTHLSGELHRSGERSRIERGLDLARQVLGDAVRLDDDWRVGAAVVGRGAHANAAGVVAQVAHPGDARLKDLEHLGAGQTEAAVLVVHAVRENT